MSPRPRASRAARRGGFTLVELLVVIGIIALLIAILLPALNKARRSAVSVSCLSQIRQIGMAIQMYANDNRYLVPHRGVGSGNWRFVAPHPNAGPNFSWPERLVWHGYIKQTVTNNWTGHYPVTGRGVFLCPGYGEGAYEKGQTVAAARGYGMNYFASAERTSPKREMWAKLNRLRKEQILLADGYASIATNLIGAFGVYPRHNDGANYLFGDLHAEWSKVYRTQNGGNASLWPNNWQHRPDPCTYPVPAAPGL